MSEAFGVAILAAGQGTRLKSKRAKVLHAAGGRTLIEQVVRTVQALGGEEIFVVVGHQAEAVRKALAPLSAASSGKGLRGHGLRFIHQKEQKGTGHALLCGRQEIEASVPLLLVVCGDTPLIRAETLREFLGFHRQSGAAATVLTVDMPDPAGYGRIVRLADGNLAAIVEQKSATPEQLAIPEINTGIYCFETRPLFGALERVAADGITGEYYLTDVIALLREAGQKVAAYKMADASEVLGINNRVELAAADALLRDRKARALMLAGVTIVRPETVLIDPDVEVGPDTIIELGVSLLGKTCVGEGCRIGAFSVVADSEIAAGVTVKQSCMVSESKIGPGASIGPFARLRMGAEIGPNASIGNFVEVKKSRIGRGTKANHLTYLGDATIGEGVNIGAGTITCNYDGEKKHPTIIEDHVFIGSGTELVAPARVGKGAYVGAGSTITEEVPPDALAIARARQASKAGWAAARRKIKAEGKKKSE